MSNKVEVIPFVAHRLKLKATKRKEQQQQKEKYFVAHFVAHFVAL